MKNLLSLSDLYLFIRKEQPLNAPSEITLKRWAASGKLDSAKVFLPGKKKPQYDAAHCFDLIFSGHKAISPQPVPLSVNPLPVSEDVRQLLENLIESFTRQNQDKMTEALAQLHDVRKFLMVRYANEVELLRNKNEILLEENRKLRASSIEQSKVSMQLSRILDKLGQLGG